MIDGVAHGCIGRSGAFGPHVAFGGEAGHEVVAGGEHGKDGALGNGLYDGLEVLGAGMQKKVDMCVDQTGQQRAGAQVDGFGACRMRDRGARFYDSIAADQHFAGSNDTSGFDVDQARGVEHDWVWSLSGERARERKDCEKRSEHRALSYHFAPP